MQEKLSSRLIRLSRELRCLAIGAIAVVAGGEALLFWGPRLGWVQVELAPAYGVLPAGVQLALRLGTAAAWIASFWFLYRALGGFGEGRAFSRELTINLKRFAALLCVAVVAHALLLPLLVKFAGTCPSGACAHIRIELADILFTIVAILVLFLTHLLDQARRIEDDHRQIV